jgi:hypothetical protein
MDIYGARAVIGNIRSVVLSRQNGIRRGVLARKGSRSRTGAANITKPKPSAIKPEKPLCHRTAAGVSGADKQYMLQKKSLT